MPPRDPTEFIGSNVSRPVDPGISPIDPSQFAGANLGVEMPRESRLSPLEGSAIGLGAGAGAGLMAWLGRGLLRRAFPGMMPRTSALKRLDEEIKRADSSSSLKEMFGKYVREAATTDKPLTFADFMAQQPGHNQAVATIRDMIGHSGNIPKIEENLLDRAGQSRERILQDIASAMNVTPQSISEGLEKLKAAKYRTAQPLYEQAFKDTEPIRDTRLLDLFGSETPNMSMMNALKARIKTLGLQGREPPTLKAADPSRRDAWKRLLTTEVPEQMFTGNDWAKLREFYAPNIEDLHHMRGNLWDEYQKAKKAGDSEAAKAYRDSWVNVTKYLDEATSGAYKAARTAYKGDSDLESAFQVGSELLGMKPDEIRVAIKGMGPAERNALAMGFYGGLQDMNQQRFVREFVRRPDLYPERREQLSTVFTDPRRLDEFMKHLEGEQAMSDAANVFTNAPLSRDPNPRTPYVRLQNPIGTAPGTDLKASVIQWLQPGQYLGWPSRRASRAGTDFLFREPTFGPNSVSHPDWGTLERMPLSGLEQAKSAGNWSGVGALGGLGAFGAYRALEDRP